MVKLGSGSILLDVGKFNGVLGFGGSGFCFKMFGVCVVFVWLCEFLYYVDGMYGYEVVIDGILVWIV